MPDSALSYSMGNTCINESFLNSVFLNENTDICEDFDTVGNDFLNFLNQ